MSAIDVRAGRIEIAVSSLDRDTKSAINVMQNSINLKVDKGGSITDINLSPGVATINADKINLNGAVMVNGTISGATSIQVTDNITEKAEGDMITLAAMSGVKISHGPLWIENESAVVSNFVGMRLVWNRSPPNAGGRLYVRNYSEEIGYLELKK